MIVGTPGMDGEAYDRRRDTFDVLLLTKGGTARVYKHYEGKKS